MNIRKDTLFGDIRKEINLNDTQPSRHEEEKMRELDALKYDNKLLKEQVAYLKERIDPFKLDIRDHFAGLAMQTLPKTSPDMEILARMSYVMADAMLKERSKSDE